MINNHQISLSNNNLSAPKSLKSSRRNEQNNFKISLHFKILCCFLLVTDLISVLNAERIEILMSNVTTQQEDAYICTSYKLTEDQQYITNVQPLATANIAHHMFAFGCEKPASESMSWNCESLVCQGPKTILFAWGRNAPALQLPDDVAFKVGPRTNYKYIVVNIHYLVKVSNDRSGLALTVSDRPRKYQAGIMLLVANYINIPPKTRKYSTKFSCKYSGKNLKMFAYRVHAHAHGDVNAAYRVRQHEWLQLAKGDPQWPQAFYPTEKTYDIKDGDALLGICTYHNDENRYVSAGNTHNDEMCNVYIMYYADSVDDVLDVCSGSVYPQLESIIPPDAEVKPSTPSSFNLNEGDLANNNFMSHHDMEGSKIHHNTQKQQQLSPQSPQKTLSYFLSNLDDYYDDVEQMRSKNRQSSQNSELLSSESSSLNNNNNQNNENPLFDTNALLEAAFNQNSNADDLDYQSDPSILLAAELSKYNSNLNKKNSNGNGNNNNNKIKGALNSLLSPKTIQISRYTQLENWYDAKLANIGQIGGIAINQKTDTIVVFHRGSQLWQSDSFNEEFRFNTRKYAIIKSDTILILNRNTGQIISSWGSNLFFMPHGLTLDSEGNIWVTDVGRHQVLKFSPNNTREPILSIGEAMIPGTDQKHFCQPSDVAVLRNGDFFVADGYCNSRIVKFNKNGEYISEWSSEDEGMPAHFFVPHSLALHEAQNLLCVADRENYRVQCFDLNGNFIHQISSAEFGPVYGVAFAANNASVLYAVNGYNSRVETQFDKKVFLISVKSGNVIGSINLSPDIRTPHDLALTDDASELYIGNLNPPRIYKYALVNYNFGKTQDKRKLETSPNKVKDNTDPDKDNFKTSMFIMAFLAIPLVIVVIAASIVRLKNMGKLKNVGSSIETRQKKLGKWMKNNRNTKNRNGFTRLNQNSDDEENERLNKDESNGKASANGGVNSDSESDSEVEINIPQLSKA